MSNCKELRKIRYSSLVILISLLVASSLFIAPGAYAAVLPTDKILNIPVSEVTSNSLSAPDMDISAGLVVNSNGEELWSRNPDTPHAIASITKVMTVLTVLHSGTPLDSVVTISENAASVGESSGGLNAGDNVSVSDLIKITLVASGNDAAIALAEYVAGSVEGFAVLMNERAQAMGMTGSHFSNPHGLDQEGHYSTPRDVVVMSRVAMNIPFIRAITSSQTVDVTVNGIPKTFQNTNDLLYTYPGVRGIKTGFTKEAGRALAFQVEREGVEITGVVLGATSLEARHEQTTKLLDWAYSLYPILTFEDSTLHTWYIRDIYSPGWSWETRLGGAATGRVFINGSSLHEISPELERISSIPMLQSESFRVYIQDGRLVSDQWSMNILGMKQNNSITGALALSIGDDLGL